MRLDPTYIAIRPRKLFETLDLALQVIREQLWPLSILWFLGALPFMIANWWLLRSFADDIYATNGLLAYYYFQVLLISNQTQVASAFITDYLGKVMFYQQSSLGQTVRSTLSTSPYFVWSHGVARMVFPMIVFASWLSPDLDDDSFVLLTMLISLTAISGLAVRCWRPFVSEILMLERTPWKKKNPAAVHFAARSANLHNAANSELIGRFVLVSIVTIPLTVLVLGSLLMVDSVVNLYPFAESIPAVFYFPLAVWIVSGFVAVGRFLSYIDIRIRQEGWDVELRVRAEAARLRQQGAIH